MAMCRLQRESPASKATNRIGVGTVTNLETEFHCTASFIPPKLDPYLIGWDKAVVCEPAKPVKMLLQCKYVSCTLHSFYLSF